jgi:hypothetical protein
MTQAEDNLQAFLALDMEYRLTIAHRIGCECARYFARRREVLIPAVLDQAAKDGAEPVDTFAAFARRVHARQPCGECVYPRATSDARSPR